MEESQSREPQITRRALTRGVAWSVPAIAVAAAVPAYAASTAAGSVIGRCLPSALAAFDVAVMDADLGTSVQILFQRTAGTGSFGVTAPNTWVLTGATATSYTYVVPTINGALTGTATINFQLQNNSATVTATATALSGTPLAGDLSAAVIKSRTGGGSSNNYTCDVVG